MGKVKKIERFIKRLYYTIINSKKADTFREKSTEELYSIYRKAKNTKDRFYFSEIRDSSWANWFTSNRERIIEIMEMVDKNAKKKIITKSDSLELSYSVDNDKDFLNYINERAKRLKIKSKVPNIPSIPSLLEHDLYFKWFNSNKERIIEMLEKTNSIPIKIVHQHKYNKPTDEIRRIIARENWNANTKFNRIRIESDKEQENKKTIKTK